MSYEIIAEFDMKKFRWVIFFFPWYSLEAEMTWYQSLQCHEEYLTINSHTPTPPPPPHPPHPPPTPPHPTPPTPPTPRQDGRHLANNNFKCMFLNENDKILIRISLKFVPRSPIDNKPALVQVMAWRRIGDKPLSEPMLTQFTDAYMRHWREMS